MADSDRKSLGRIGEEAAAVYLEKKGYTVTAKNVRIGRSEIDIICEKDDFIVFAEVKTRHLIPENLSVYGSAASAVDEAKQNALIRGSEGYTSTHPTDKIPRIDVIEVYVSPTEPFAVTEIVHMENAVQKSGKFSKKSKTRRFHNEAD